MHLISYIYKNKTSSGILTKDKTKIISFENCGLSNDINEVIHNDNIAKLSDIQNNYNKDLIDLSEVKIISPIPFPRRDIICVGKNYFEHAEEFHKSGFDSSAGKSAVPDHPIIFTKATTSVVGPNDNIIADNDPSNSIDYEGELGVIIGKDSKNIKKDNAYDVVFGYTVINDVTARNLQNQHKQWFIGKSPDTFCPMGPAIVTKDEITDVTKLNLVTKVNGEKRQDAIVSDLIFDIPTLIETITKSTTLVAGDIIATGTPVGVGIGFSPPKFLVKGDKVTVSINGIGELNNTVV